MTLDPPSKSTEPGPGVRDVALPIDPDVDLRYGRAHPGRRGQRRAGRGRRRRWDVLCVIAGGGVIGAVGRYGVGVALPTAAGEFPWATLIVNISGCFLLGLLMVFVSDVWPPSRYLRPFLGVGVLGGFTTFSTYAVEARDLIARGQLALADAYVLDSLVGGLAAVWLGITCARLIARLPVPRAPRRNHPGGRCVGGDDGLR